MNGNRGWSMSLPDFDTGNPVTIELEPEKCRPKCPKSLQAIKTQTRSQCCGATSRGESRNRVFGASEAAIAQMDEYQTLEDLEALKEIRRVDSAALSGRSRIP